MHLKPHFFEIIEKLKVILQCPYIFLTSKHLLIQPLCDPEAVHLVIFRFRHSWIADTIPFSK